MRGEIIPAGGDAAAVGAPAPPTIAHTFMPASGKPPRTLLSRTFWSYHDREAYADAAEFDAAVREYQDGDGEWTPETRALDATSIRVSYHGVPSPDAEAYEDYTVTLSSDDPRGFTHLELFHKLHNAVVAHLNAVDHCFFEGLELQDVEGGIPHYEMAQGS